MKARFRHVLHLTLYLGTLGLAFSGAYVFAGKIAVSPPKATRLASATPTPTPTEQATVQPTLQPTARASPITTPSATIAFAVEGGGFALVPEQVRFRPLEADTLRFRLTAPNGGAAQLDADADHGTRLFLVRRDLRYLRVLTPTPAENGIWSVPLLLPTAGDYRLFAEFTPAGDGDRVTVTADLQAEGLYRPVPLPAPSRTTRTDAYTVRLNGDPRSGEDSLLTFTMSRFGVPINDLMPRQGGFGDLIVLRESDLARVRVSAGPFVAEGALGGPDVVFHTFFPASGTYRLFLDLQRVNGRPRTYTFTVIVPTPSIDLSDRSPNG